MISSIGGVITLLISQSQVSSRFYPVWLVIGVALLLYLLWGPIVEAGQKNAQLRKFPVGGLFSGQISELLIREKVENRHEQANHRGELELVDEGDVNLLLKKKGSDDPGFFNNYEGGISIRVPAEVRKETQGFMLPNVSRSLFASTFKGIGKLTGLAVDLIPNENQQEIANYFKDVKVGYEGESVYSMAEKIARGVAPLADPPREPKKDPAPPKGIKKRRNRAL